MDEEGTMGLYEMVLEELLECTEFYAFELAEKNRAVKKHASTSVEVASDYLAFRVLNVTADYAKCTP